MASRLLGISLTTTNRFLASPAPARVSPVAVKMTFLPVRHSISAGFRSLTVFINLNRKMKTKMRSNVKKEEVEITDVYNTSQKILIACVGDFAHAHHIAYELGDARNIVVISPNSCGEVKRLHEHAWWQILELEKLGATLVFNVDFMDMSSDSRINQTLYDITNLVL